MVARTEQSCRTSVIGIAFVGVLMALASDAFAQGVGFQGGVSIDPERMYVGSHVETKEIARGLHFRPGIDGAFGGDLTLASINVDFLYKFELGPTWNIYQGGGPVVHILRQGEPARNDVTGGLGGIFGFAHDSGFFVEFRAGGGGVANVKFGVGFTIR